MLGMLPIGGIQSTSQSTAQAVTTAAAQLVITGGVETAGTRTREGDPAVKPDTANNRIVVNAPGIYKATVSISGAAASALQNTYQLRKNGSSGSAITGTRAKQVYGTTPSQVSWSSMFEITAADLPAAGGTATFSDPDSSAGAGKPAGGFAGAGAAPKTGVPIDILVTGDGSVNFTPTDIQFIIERVG